ncbi:MULTISPECIES: zinc-dependent alcohol dehydrogenase family protein [Pseudomonas]|nr:MULTISPECIES: NAD(P)-dependent alcohol dehydrogenase [Pseudomonas]WIN08841.1 NAD(P)-dependent alcohol dehydrogenase [Pseudomonas syringae pv. antirrhini str. 126]
MTETVAPAKASKGHVLVKVIASSLNYHDYWVATRSYVGGKEIVPLSDCAGIVVGIGDEVTKFSLGDRVVSTYFPTWVDYDCMPSDCNAVPGDGIDGYAQEYVSVPEGWLTFAPKDWSFEEAATITTAGVTAWRALNVDTQVSAGQTVLVLGTGGVSIYALQLAKHAGATVIATTSSDAKTKRLIALGADHVVNYKETPEWGSAVRQLTGGKGADIVVEVGGPGTLKESMIAASVGGHIAMIGALTGGMGEISTVQLLLRQQTLKGLMVGTPADQQRFIDELNRSTIRPVIDRAFGINDLAEAFEWQASGQHFGKIVVSIAAQK